MKPKNKYEKLADYLEKCGHNQTSIAYQVYYVVKGRRDIDIHDDTCCFITSPLFADDDADKSMAIFATTLSFNMISNVELGVKIIKDYCVSKKLTYAISFGANYVQATISGIDVHNVFTAKDSIEIEFAAWEYSQQSSSEVFTELT